MNKRQHKKNFINKVYGLSLNNDYVVVEFDKNRTKPQQCEQIMSMLANKIDRSKLIGMFDVASIKVMNLENIIGHINFLNNKIKELEK